jgi:uncharacterized cupin superfamily protein
MAPVNISNPTFTYDEDDPEGFRAGMFRLGTMLGARRTGTSVYELPPRQALCPYHYEYGEEEWVMVLIGNPTLRTPEGEQRLEPFDVVFFQTGPEGAHQLRNDSGDETVRIIMWSEVVLPTATAYPDSDKVGLWTDRKSEDLMAQRSSAVPYFHGESNA